MKNGLIILLVIVVGLMITNPGQEDFKEYMSRNIQKELVRQADDDQIARILKPLANGVAQLGGALSSAFAQRENYYLFSIYTLGPDDNPDNPKYLGIAKQFIPLN